MERKINLLSPEGLAEFMAEKEKLPIADISKGEGVVAGQRFYCPKCQSVNKFNFNSPACTSCGNEFDVSTTK